MGKTHTFLVSSIIGISLLTGQASAVVHSGWTISSSYVWRLLNNSDYTFNQNSPAKVMQLDRTVKHRQAVFHVTKSMTNRYTFKTGCMYQSETPVFELDVSTLDISINDLYYGNNKIIKKEEIKTKKNFRPLFLITLAVIILGIFSVAYFANDNSNNNNFKINFEGFDDFKYSTKKLWCFFI